MIKEIYGLLRSWEGNAEVIHKMKREIKEFEDGKPFEINEYDLYELLPNWNDEKRKEKREETIETMIERNEMIEMKLSKKGINAREIVLDMYPFLKY